MGGAPFGAVIVVYAATQHTIVLAIVLKELQQHMRGGPVL